MRFVFAGCFVAGAENFTPAIWSLSRFAQYIRPALSTLSSLRPAASTQTHTPRHTRRHTFHTTPFAPPRQSPTLTRRTFFRPYSFSLEKPHTKPATTSNRICVPRYAIPDAGRGADEGADDALGSGSVVVVAVATGGGGCVGVVGVVVVGDTLAAPPHCPCAACSARRRPPQFCQQQHY